MLMKIDRDLILLPNDRYGVVALVSIYFELLMGCPNRKFQFKVDQKLKFFRENWEIEKNQEIFKKNKKR